MVSREDISIILTKSIDKITKCATSYTAPNNASFKKIRTNQELADYYGFEYTEKGRYSESTGMTTFEFYDKENDVVLRFAKDETHRISTIDYNNNGEGLYDIKDILEIYNNLHPNLKVGISEINFLKGDEHSPGGDAGKTDINIYEGGVSRDEFEPFESTLDHEAGHIFSNTFVEFDKGQYIQMDSVAWNLRVGFDDARSSDQSFQESKGYAVQDVSYYAETNQSERFAETVSQVHNLEFRGNNYKVFGQYQRWKDDNKASGYRRVRPTLKMTNQRNPSQYKYVKELLDNPEKFMPNWKKINQKRIIDDWKQREEFFKQEGINTVEP